MGASVLPDSRLQSAVGCIMADWELPDGRTVRIEVQPIFCGNCGKHYGFVPKENTTFAFWLCRKCYEKYGAVAGTCAVPEDEFNRSVEAEMVERFGRSLTAVEVAALKEQDKLGRMLELLEKESPYPVPQGA